MFDLIFSAHNALVAHNAAYSTGRDMARTTVLDGSGSGCGPTGGNCSGGSEMPTQAPDKSNSSSYKLGTSPLANSNSENTHSLVTKGFFGDHSSLPANRGYELHSFRDGSPQNVNYAVPVDYTGYGHTGMHGGLFKFYGSPDASNTASAMVGHNPDSGVVVHARAHAFGGSDPSANAMILPAGHEQLGFYGSHHTMSWGKSVTVTNARPEQVPEAAIVHANGGGTREASFIMGHSFTHSQSMAQSTAFIHSGQATPATEANFIVNDGVSFSHTAVADHPYGVSFASQTLREEGMPNDASNAMALNAQNMDAYNRSLDAFNSSAMTSSAYAMTASTAQHGSRILSRPYHPARVDFCSMHPDRCFFSPAPETQSVDGGYHSI